MAVVMLIWRIPAYGVAYGVFAGFDSALVSLAAGLVSEVPDFDSDDFDSPDLDSDDLDSEPWDSDLESPLESDLPSDFPAPLEA